MPVAGAFCPDTTQFIMLRMVLSMTNNSDDVLWRPIANRVFRAMRVTGFWGST